MMNHSTSGRLIGRIRGTARTVVGAGNRHSRKIATSAIMLGLVCASGTHLAVGESPSWTGLFSSPANAAPTPTARAPIAGPPASANQVTTPFRSHAGQAGLGQCANLYQQLGQGLTAGASYAVNTQWDRSAPNAHAVQGLVGMSYDVKDYKAQAAGVVFASPVGQKCEGNLVRVAPIQKSCAEVARTLPGGSALFQNLSGTPLYNLGGNRGEALLVPSGNNTCVVVTIAHMAG